MSTGALAAPNRPAAGAGSVTFALVKGTFKGAEIGNHTPRVRSHSGVVVYALGLEFIRLEFLHLVGDQAILAKWMAATSLWLMADHGVVV